ncbi:MAG: AIPR protein [Gammaproteobacteria bacterium]|nr:AIPR protein [Gammaproteobacteria bacterium]MYI76460.1 AIPR protein [Gammaproteobacteria bacterium]
MFEQIQKEIQNDYYRQRFDNDGTRFVAWYVRNIHRRDMIETVEDVTDGPDDKQIDAIVVDDENSTIFVIQGKFTTRDTVDAEPLREVLASWFQLFDLVRLQETGNQKLKRRLPEVATALENEYRVAFELVITGSLTDEASSDLEHFQRKLIGAEDFSADLHVVDLDEIKSRYQMTLDVEHPLISHELKLENGKYMVMQLGQTKCIIAAMPLAECITFPGISDGTLFQKNVRQSLGLKNNRVNKGIRDSIYGEDSRDFFFLHNGVTALCSRADIANGTLTVRNVNVVNGCQSLNTMLSCSERVKELDEAYVMFRFYEIPERERADRISISTNSQSSVKPRDLRSNDRRVLAIKRAYEQRFPNGYFITKRGEDAPANKDEKFVVDLLELGKWLIAWHSQRPNVSYSESQIFDRHFEQLFKRGTEYSPENIDALNRWMTNIMNRWVPANPIGMNETLLAMKAYAPYHHLYAVSLVFCKANGIMSRVPEPALSFEKALKADQVDQIVEMAGACLSNALEVAAEEFQALNKVFSPQNWIKTKTCLAGIRLSITNFFGFLSSNQQGRDTKQNMQEHLNMHDDYFEDRWTAD